MKRTSTFCILLFLYVSKSTALPWFQQAPITAKKGLNKHQVHVDFSGYWQGVCDQQPAEDLLISQQENRISLHYNSIEETYRFGEFSSQTSIEHGLSNIAYSMASWNETGDKLIFFNSSYYTDTSEHLHFFLSKVVLSITDNQLMILGKHIQTSNRMEGNKQEELRCYYHRK